MQKESTTQQNNNDETSLQDILSFLKKTGAGVVNRINKLLENLLRLVILFLMWNIRIWKVTVLINKTENRENVKKIIIVCAKESDAKNWKCRLE